MIVDFYIALKVSKVKKVILCVYLDPDNDSVTLDESNVYPYTIRSGR